MNIALALLGALLLVSVLETVRAGGKLPQGITTGDRSKSALSHSYANLDETASDQFLLGRSFFHVPWVEAPAATTARDGLGPLFNANTCASCHPNNGGGAALKDNQFVDRSIIIKLSQANSHHLKKTSDSFHPDPVYGHQLSINGNVDVPFEGQAKAQLVPIEVSYHDGTSLQKFKPDILLSQLNYGGLSPETQVTALRAPALIGLGLIEQIPEQQILQHQDEDDLDKDGISGRANKVWSVEHKTHKMGRYGWKATTPSVIEQSARALIDDMSLTTPWFDRDNCTNAQQQCNAAYKSQGPDVPQHRLQGIAHYLTHLKLPVLTKEKNTEGRALFQQLGCASCHRNGYQISQGITVNPYSDFLLHDMGLQLAGNMKAFDASPTEWRTAPLWGIGLSRVLNPDAGYLHDGRASTIEQAIMWHGGEASASQQAFAALSTQQREQLLTFLNSL